MKANFVLAFVTVAALGGCSSSYHNPNVSQQQSDADHKDCTRESYAYGGMTGGIEGVLQRNEIQKYCLEKRGYSR